MVLFNYKPCYYEQANFEIILHTATLIGYFLPPAAIVQYNCYCLLFGII